MSWVGWEPCNNMNNQKGSKAINSITWGGAERVRRPWGHEGGATVRGGSGEISTLRQVQVQKNHHRDKPNREAGTKGTAPSIPFILRQTRLPTATL